MNYIQWSDWVIILELTMPTPPAPQTSEPVVDVYVPRSPDYTPISPLRQPVHREFLCSSDDDDEPTQLTGNRRGRDFDDDEWRPRVRQRVSDAQNVLGTITRMTNTATVTVDNRSTVAAELRRVAALLNEVANSLNNNV